MILRRHAVYKQYSWGVPGGVTDSCFWDPEEAAKTGIHNIIENGDHLIRKWTKIQERKYARDRQRYLYLTDMKHYRLRKLRSKRLNQKLRPYWEWLCQQLENRCQICHIPQNFWDLEVDHIYPLSKGGTNTWDNIQPLCESCNSKKSAKIIPPSSSILEAQGLALALGLVKKEKRHE